LLAVDERQPSAAATEGSDDSGLQKMFKSQYREDARNFTDFFIAYATIPGYMRGIATTKFTQNYLFGNMCYLHDLFLFIYFFTF